jgi:hypothetical protein
MRKPFTIALGKGSFVLETRGVFGEDASLPRAGNFSSSGASSAE